MKGCRYWGRRTANGNLPSSGQQCCDSTAGVLPHSASHPFLVALASWAPHHMNLFARSILVPQTCTPGPGPQRLATAGLEEATVLIGVGAPSHTWFPSPPHGASCQRLIASICPTDSRGCQGSKNFQIPPHPALPGYFSSSGPSAALPTSCSFSRGRTESGSEWHREASSRGCAAKASGPLFPSEETVTAAENMKAEKWVEGTKEKTYPFYRRGN